MKEAELGKEGLLAGRPKGLRLEIIRPTDAPLRGPLSRLKLRKGGCGEIVVAGAHVQKSYLNDTEAVKRNKIMDGGLLWHRTGDAGYLDRQGRLFLAGRVSQRLRRGGKTYWPGPAELKALRLPGVRFAACLPWKGQSLLCLEGSAGLEEARRAVAPWPVDALRCLERIPRDPRHASKLDREALLKLLEAS